QLSCTNLPLSFLTTLLLPTLDVHLEHQLDVGGQGALRPWPSAQARIRNEMGLVRRIPQCSRWRLSEQKCGFSQLAAPGNCMPEGRKIAIREVKGAKL